MSKIYSAIDNKAIFVSPYFHNGKGVYNPPLFVLHAKDYSDHEFYKLLEKMMKRLSDKEIQEQIDKCQSIGDINKLLATYKSSEPKHSDEEIHQAFTNIFNRDTNWRRTQYHLIKNINKCVDEVLFEIRTGSSKYDKNAVTYELKDKDKQKAYELLVEGVSYLINGDLTKLDEKEKSLLQNMDKNTPEYKQQFKTELRYISRMIKHYSSTDRGSIIYFFGEENKSVKDILSPILDCFPKELPTSKEGYEEITKKINNFATDYRKDIKESAQENEKDRKIIMESLSRQTDLEIFNSQIQKKLLSLLKEKFASIRKEIDTKIQKFHKTDSYDDRIDRKIYIADNTIKMLEDMPNPYKTKKIEDEIKQKEIKKTNDRNINNQWFIRTFESGSAAILNADCLSEKDIKEACDFLMNVGEMAAQGKKLPNIKDPGLFSLFVKSESYIKLIETKQKIVSVFENFRTDHKIPDNEQFTDAFDFLKESIAQQTKDKGLKTPSLECFRFFELDASRVKMWERFPVRQDNKTTLQQECYNQFNFLRDSCIRSIKQVKTNAKNEKSTYAKVAKHTTGQACQWGDIKKKESKGR